MLMLPAKLGLLFGNRANKASILLEVQASPNPGVRESGAPYNPPGLPKITERESKGLPR